MQHCGLKADSAAYNTVIDAYSSEGLWQQAIAVLQEMVQHNFKPDVGTYHAAMKGAARAASGSKQLIC